MTALPTTADFITYESVYLPKKHFIKAETLSTEEYLSYFYPFDKPDFRKNGVESEWSVTGREGIAITMAVGNEFCSPQCKNQFNVYKSREKKKGNK